MKKSVLQIQIATSKRDDFHKNALINVTLDGNKFSEKKKKNRCVLQGEEGISVSL